MVVGKGSLTKFLTKKKIELPSELSEMSGCVFSMGRDTVIYIEPSKEVWDTFDTIIHESVHVWQVLMKFVGEDVHGIEQEAYTIARISTTLLKEFIALGEKECLTCATENAITSASTKNITVPPNSVQIEVSEQLHEMQPTQTDEPVKVMVKTSTIGSPSLKEVLMRNQTPEFVAALRIAASAATKTGQ